jgi:O-antigen/teichoic acid export membrane protein
VSAIEPEANPVPLRERVRSAVFWRSGSQIVAQMIAWTATFLVIRMLHPEDYGLFAMASLVVIFMSLLEGYGFASSLIQRETVEKEQIRQVFGLLILLNIALAATQLALAPWAAAYFREPRVTDILRVQALLYLTTPFIALPFALLSRELEYKKQALANLVGSIAGAATALTLALLGFGVWTLVYAPIVMFIVRGIGLTWAARSLVMPSFAFKGAGAMIGFGGAMTAIQFFWFLQSQSDVFIAGRAFDAHMLGVYTTALFLTQILVSKFVPPLNDVAFATYSRMHREGAPIAPAFANAVRLIMLIALPFYLGLAITAEPLVTAMLGDQWLETIPLVRLLALAMPFMTLQILFAPATNALGRPWIAVRVNMMGAAIMAGSFAIGVNYGIEGLARVWLIGFPVLIAVTMLASMPVIGIGIGAFGRALFPGLAASLAMAGIVEGVELMLPPMPLLGHLALLVLLGIASYALLLIVFARPLVIELRDLLIRRKPLIAEA